MANDDAVKRQFGEWLALTVEERKRLGMPKSQAKYAEQWGLNPRTLTRWKEDPVVIATVNRARARSEKTSEPVDLPESPAEGLERLQQDLLGKALGGDEKAIDQYMRFFGKDALEDQRRAHQAGIQQLSDEELVDQILEMIGAKTVAHWLEQQHA